MPGCCPPEPGVPCWVDTSQPDTEAVHWVESADEAAAKVRDAGGHVVSDPFDVMDAGRMAVVTDPEGAAFCVWQAKQHEGARIVNEPGSLNFNSLNTRDAKGAKSFYRSVFGWETLGLESGVEVWRLAGYGDFLAQSDPELRKRQAHSRAAPEGFADVVATLNPIADDQPEILAHWSVTFAVDDADATARRAAELGGRVDVAPFDAPWVRMTVITDPQGATFTASKFVPENRGGDDCPGLWRPTALRRHGYSNREARNARKPIGYPNRLGRSVYREVAITEVARRYGLEVEVATFEEWDPAGRTLEAQPFQLA